jgi:maltooligosyltrehalose trehalohydrolase
MTSSSTTASTSWSLQRGATLLANGDVRFALWAPNAERVAVRLYTGPAAGDHDLEPSERTHGLFEGTVPKAGAGADYKYLLTQKAAPEPDPALATTGAEDVGAPRAESRESRAERAEPKELPDPVSRWQPEGVHGPSRVVDPAAFRWTDDAWKGVGLERFVVYELHVGTFTEGGTFESAIAGLDRLVALGVTAIEIMPVAEFPGARNWGYDGVALYAPQSGYGGPEGLKRLVDAAHARGLAVVLDVVYNHVGPEGNYLGEFGPYFTDRYQTPWGKAVNYDGPDSDEVRRFVLDNARHWVTEYHVDALRLDAVHGIFDFGARHLLEELADEVHAVGERLGRPVVLIAESDLNDPRLIREKAQGGYGLDAQWSDDFHHAVHAALTGETKGYYSDFGPVRTIAESLREPFVYAGHYSPHRRRRHGAPSVGIPRWRFVVSIQNHDQVGNRATGERFGTLLSPEKQRLAAALLLLAPYVPMLWMGEEYGETNPFLYFVSHGDPQLVEAVREGRKREFASFAWSGEVPDPQAEESFHRSRLDLSKLERAPHAGIAALYRDLLALRRDEAQLRPGPEPAQVETSGEGAVSMLRGPGLGARAGFLALFNVSGAEQEVAVPATAPGAWTLRLSTDAVAYGGRGSAPQRIEGGEADGPKRLASARTVRLAPWSAALFEREG